MHNDIQNAAEGNKSAFNNFVIRLCTADHKRAIKRLMIVLLPALYLTAIPAEIVKYGIANKIPAFDNGAPFYEVYSVFCTVWMLGHLGVGVLLLSIYMLCYGCNSEN